MSTAVGNLQPADVRECVGFAALQPGSEEFGNNCAIDDRHKSAQERPSSSASTSPSSDQGIEPHEALCDQAVAADSTPQKYSTAIETEVPDVAITFGSIKNLSPWLPSVNPELSTWRTKKSRRKVVIWTCITIAFTIFAVNLTLTCVSWTQYDLSSDAVATLYRGDCTFSKRLNTGLHVAINVLSTLLLSSSNLCLQLLLAPTRAEVDQAHSQHRWLDIGVSSWRNLRNLSIWNKCVWICLAASSLPIHFLYNSVVFSTVSTNSYVYATVTEAFVRPLDPGLTFQLSNGSEASPPLEYQTALDTRAQNGYSDFGSFIPLDSHVQEQIMNIHADLQQNFDKYDRLDNYDCLTNYSTIFGWRPHVLLISDNYDTAVEHNTSLLTYGYNDGYIEGRLNPISWTNDPRTSWQALGTISPSDAAAWAELGNRVQYCLRRPDISGTTEFHECRVQCAPLLLLVVSIFNLAKCLCMLWLLYIRSEQTLCTLGDAIASFLQQPDLHTRDCGIATKTTIQASEEQHDTWNVGQSGSWQSHKIRWYRAASPTRWWLTMTLSLTILVGGMAVLSTGFDVVKHYQGNVSLETLWSFGFGATDSTEIISWGQPTYGRRGLFFNIVIANIWQVLLSLCYIAQNTLLSCLLIAEEWSGFLNQRKSLRVSHPRGIQRSTYFVNMPMRYGVPMMILFAIQHWLLSQSTFIIRVVNLNIIPDPPQEMDGLTTSGFSLPPAIIAVVLPLLLLAMQLANAFLRVYDTDSAMPLVSTCSAAISANCHRPQADVDAHLLPVQWGVVGENEHGLQLCSFTTSRHVSAPLTQGQFLMLQVPDKQVKSSPQSRYMSCLDGLWNWRKYTRSRRSM